MSILANFLKNSSDRKSEIDNFVLIFYSCNMTFQSHVMSENRSALWFIVSLFFDKGSSQFFEHEFPRAESLTAYTKTITWLFSLPLLSKDVFSSSTIRPPYRYSLSKRQARKNPARIPLMRHSMVPRSDLQRRVILTTCSINSGSSDGRSSLADPQTTASADSSSKFVKYFFSAEVRFARSALLKRTS